jgi:predicted nucleic acid-binding protein
MGDNLAVKVRYALGSRKEAIGSRVTPVISPVFPLTDEVNAIAAKFVEEGIVPAKYKDDGLHLALALTNNIDYIVSWNFKHIVKLKTKRAVKAFSIKEGYKEIEITTPQEVIESED